MSEEPKSKERIINGRVLTCIVCNNDKFWTRKSLMNTREMTLFNLDWANKEAQNYICDSCGYVYWFLQRE